MQSFLSSFTYTHMDIHTTDLLKLCSIARDISSHTCMRHLGHVVSFIIMYVYAYGHTHHRPAQTLLYCT